MMWGALITDVSLKMIVCWRVTKAPSSALALDAVEQALHARDAGGAVALLLDGHATTPSGLLWCGVTAPSILPTGNSGFSLSTQGRAEEWPPAVDHPPFVPDGGEEPFGARCIRDSSDSSPR